MGPRQRPDVGAAQAESNRQALEARRGGPCLIGGTTLTPVRTAWVQRTVTGNDQSYTGSVCARCLAWAGDTQLRVQGWRSLAASVLLGRSSPTSIRRDGYLGRDVGLRLWCEAGLRKGTTEPFGWLDAEAIGAEARAKRLAANDCRVTRWQNIDPQLAARPRW